MDFNWDKISEEQEEYTPIEMEKQDPAKPYNTRKVKDSLVISEKTTKENFQGHGWNPEGPAGTEGNTPPGYKASDDQFAKYSKKEDIKNHAVNKTNRKIDRDPYDIAKVSVAIAIDGLQNLPKTARRRIMTWIRRRSRSRSRLTQEELKKAENIVKKSINFNEGRGDQVAVENIMFDRSKYWESLRDEFRKKEQIKKILLAALIGVIALFVGFILFRAITKELERRRRSQGRTACPGTAADAGGCPPGGGRGGHRRGALPGRKGAGWNCRRTPSTWPGNGRTTWPSSCGPGWRRNRGILLDDANYMLFI